MAYALYYWPGIQGRGANILHYLGPRLGLAPRSEAGRAKAFLAVRLPKFLRYFAGVKGEVTDVHLSLFQMVEGLRYAFPNAMRRLEPDGLAALHGKVAKRRRLAAYLASSRRIPFNQEGIFRHYPELDEPRRRR